MEENVRKLCLMLVTGVAVLTTGTLPSRADGLPGTGYQPAVESPVYEGAVVEQVGLACTHFWNGHWHYRRICGVVDGYRHHHHHHWRRHFY
jgi:hypothetical protein